MAVPHAARLLWSLPLALCISASSVFAQEYGNWSVTQESPKAVIISEPANAANVTVSNSGDGDVWVYCFYRDASGSWKVKSGFPIELPNGDDTIVGCQTSEKIEVALKDAEGAEGGFSITYPPQ